MAICYDRLFHLMIDKKISNAHVSIESIEKICRVMECGVDDILEFVPEEK